MLRRQMFSVLATTMLWLTLGCTIGPVSEVHFVMCRPGHPIEILQNVKVKGRRLKDGNVGVVDVGGFIAMPKEHWELIEKKLQIE